MIVPMTAEHLEQVAALHTRHVKSLLADLGPRLCRAFYATALRSPNCLGFVDVEGGHVRGFALGALDNSRLFTDWRLRLKLLRALVGKPALITRILFHLKGDLAPAPEILYEAVDPSFRRQGIATALTLALVEGFRARGVAHYEIRVDKTNQANLARHCKLGARIVREFDEDGIARYLLDNNII
nr:hypothetical protein with GCN5-related N-acetyltransferase domain [uncultured bacterium]